MAPCPDSHIQRNNATVVVAVGERGFAVGERGFAVGTVVADVSEYSPQIGGEGQFQYVLIAKEDIGALMRLYGRDGCLLGKSLDGDHHTATIHPDEGAIERNHPVQTSSH